MKFSAYQRSELGGRTNNEDRVGYLYTPESALFVIADGMGGHANGEIAAQIALDTMTQAFQEQAHPVIAQPKDFLSSTLLQAHHNILSFSNDTGLSDSPRTTLTALLVQDGAAMWIHCGDSRLYLIRDERLMNRTLDHSYAEQASRGSSSYAVYLEKVANRHVLFTCLGAPNLPIYDISPSVELQRSDKFLLCTDGLWSAITGNDIVRFLSQAPVTLSASRLIDTAVQRGGSNGDNVTVLSVEWDSQ